jgi:hypothetical protein
MKIENINYAFAIIWQKHNLYFKQNKFLQCIDNKRQKIYNTKANKNARLGPKKLPK